MTRSSNSTSGGQAGLGSSALTPLLDTLFLLLFTLLATSRSASIVEHAVREEVAVELPSIEDGPDAQAGSDDVGLVTIAVPEEGKVRVLTGRSAERESREVETPAALEQLLTSQVKGAVGARVEIRADGAARHAVVLEVLQAVRAAGCTDVRFIALEAEASLETRPFGGRSRDHSDGGR